MRRPKNLKILVTPFLILFASVQVYGQSLLTNVETYAKCYSKITDHPVDPTSADYKAVAANKLNPVTACMDTLKKANFVEINDQRVLANKNDIISRSILRNFHQFHLSWFTSLHSNNTHDTLHAFVDNTEPGLFITDALFGEKHYKTITTSNTPLRGVREQNSPATYVVNTLNLSPVDITVGGKKISAKRILMMAPMDKTPATPDRYFDVNTIDKKVPLGPLVGIQTAPTVTIPLPPFAGRATLTPTQLASTMYEGTSVNLTENYGGGILGVPSLFINNVEQYGAMDGGLKVHRRWANNIFYDILCSSLPNLPENNSEVKKEHELFMSQNSNLSFRTNTTCLACHTTIDNLAHVARNVQIRDLANNNFERDFRESHPEKIFSSFFGVYKHKAREPATTIIDVDPLYNKREPKGSVTYMNYDKKFINRPVTGLQEYGEVLASENDLYVCAAKRYYKFFTGVDVPLTYIPLDKDKKPKNAADTFNHYHRQTVINLGVKLKTHGSLQTLIEEILKTKTFKARNPAEVGGN